MEPIKPIGIPNITIPQVAQRDWIYGIPFVPSNHSPVTLQLGFPSPSTAAPDAPASPMSPIPLGF